MPNPITFLSNRRSHSSSPDASSVDETTAPSATGFEEELRSSTGLTTGNSEDAQGTSRATLRRQVGSDPRIHPSRSIISSPTLFRRLVNRGNSGTPMDKYRTISTADSRMSSDGVLSPVTSLQQSGAVGAKIASVADVMQFKTDPDDFMQRNVVVVAGLPRISGETNQPTSLRLYEWPNKSSSKEKVYRVATLQETSPRNLPEVLAYFCKYRQDSCTTIEIGHEANLLLTPTLSGCTIGVQALGNGRLAFCHANARTAPNQSEKQIADVHAALGPNAIVITPQDYRQNPDDRTSVAGILRDGSWSIHFTSYAAGPDSKFSGISRTYRVTVPPLA